MFPLAFLLRVRLEEMKCHQLVSTIQQKYKWLLAVLITVRVKSVLGCMVGDIYGTARKRKSCLSWKVSDTCAWSSANWYRDSTDKLDDRVKGKEAGKTLIAFPCRANDRCHFFFTPNITIKLALFFAPRQEASGPDIAILSRLTESDFQSKYSGHSSFFPIGDNIGNSIWLRNKSND